MTPRIAVVIPCFNHGRYLDEAVDSVFAQTCQDFEVVIVDDGSTERETVERLAGWRRPRTTVVRQENRGLSAARNAGIRRTSAPYICALDADDRLAPTWFEKATAVLDGDPSIAFVSHWLQAFGDEDWTWTPESCALPALLARNTVNGAALVRRDAWAAAGGFDEDLRRGCEDWDFWLTLVERGYRGTIIPEVLFYYRRRADSMSRQMMADGTHVDLFRALVEKHRSSYQAHLVDVVAQRDAEIARLQRECDDLEVEHDTWLAPRAAALREAAARLRPRVEALAAAEAAAAEQARLEAGVAALEREVADLRGSWSWRVTRPLRAVYGWLRGERTFRR